LCGKYQSSGGPPPFAPNPLEAFLQIGRGRSFVTVVFFPLPFGFARRRVFLLLSTTFGIPFSARVVTILASSLMLYTVLFAPPEGDMLHVFSFCVSIRVYKVLFFAPQIRPASGRQTQLSPPLMFLSFPRFFLGLTTLDSDVPVFPSVPPNAFFLCCRVVPLDSPGTPTPFVIPLP